MEPIHFMNTINISSQTLFSKIFNELRSLSNALTTNSRHTIIDLLFYTFFENDIRNFEIPEGNKFDKNLTSQSCSSQKIT